jgi:MinD-like ATPase involved in chromosome partitioning or flagellar assembly
MAMANVAAELVQKGRRVLVVDFDLEAPGLDTFRLGKATNKSQGLVDYLYKYWETGVPPEIDEYIYEAVFSTSQSGQLWIMPAGEASRSYDNHFRAIDWQTLYEERDGFLLFENLKAQWKSTLQPDYVLIDSRTGHTDTGGICTRQLPDAVVVFFFPNEQNRRGLETVVEQIRAEIHGPLEKAIKLHFVMANVPDLDDEEEILAANLRKIRETLQFTDPTAVIHHYSSLSLLNQTVFTVERPRSRLAQEYRDLTSAIVRGNLEDEEGALAYLDDALRQVRSRALPNTSQLEADLAEIRATHANNGEVLRRLARVRTRQAKSKEALALLTSAIDQGFVDSDILIQRAQLAASTEQSIAVSDLTRLLRLSEVTSLDLTIAIRVLRKVAPDAVARLLSDAPALRSAKLDIELARELESSPETLSRSEELLRRWRSDPRNAAFAEGIRNELVLCLIGEGRFSEAKEEASQQRTDPNEYDVVDAFNYAMAEWGQLGNPPRVFLERVATLYVKQPVSSNDPNRLQCIGLTMWALGDKAAAMVHINKAALRVLSRGSSVFSCWSYLTVDPEHFIKEINEMRALLNGQADILPRFIARARSSSYSPAN